MRQVLALAVACCATLLLAAAPASADDKSVSDAWDSQDPAFEQLSASLKREVRAWEKRDFTRDGKLLKLYRRGEQLSLKVVAALQAQQPSTPQGGQARDLAIQSTQHLAGHFVAERRFVRAARPGNAAAARKAAREAERLYDLSVDVGKQAKAIFVQLGLD